MQGKELKGAGGQACNECALLGCRPCYEYEHEDGVQQGVDGLLKRQGKAAGWQRHQEPNTNLQY